jgi:cytoskeletal protein CcmA (bactofilin family)
LNALLGITVKNGNRETTGPETLRSNGMTAIPSTIGKDLTVEGNLDCDGDILVDGTIIGDIRTKTVTIGTTGAVTGAITADMVVVVGNVAGQIRAKTVTLSRTARVQAEIWHESLAIEGGAWFEGTCKRLSGVDRETEKPPAKPPAPAMVGMTKLDGPPEGTKGNS